MSDTDNVDELAQRRRNRKTDTDDSSRRDDSAKRAARKKNREERQTTHEIPTDNAAGFGHSWGLVPGQNVRCRVTSSEPGGYCVWIEESEEKVGFLPTATILKVGEEVLAQFVCMHKGRLLLSARFSST